MSTFTCKIRHVRAFVSACGPRWLIWSLLLTLLTLGSTGCLKYVLVMGNPSQKAAAYQSVIKEAVGDAPQKKDCPRWIAGVNSIRDKLPIVHGRNPSWYGSEIGRAYDTCTLEAIQDLESGKDSPLERSKRAVARFDLILSMPLAALNIQDSKEARYSPFRPGEASLRTLRAKTAESVVMLEQAHTRRLALEAKRVDLARTAESNGWTLAALVTWMTVQPLDDATKQAQAEAMARLPVPARAAAAVPVALVPAAVDGPKPATLEQVRATDTLNGKPTLQLVAAGTNGAVRVELTVGKPTRNAQKSTLDFQHTYVSGSRMVRNPEIEKLQEAVAHHEKEAEWNRKGAESACKGQKGRCQTKEMKYKEAERQREKAQKARQDLSRAKPMVQQDTKDVYSYTGDKTLYSVTVPIAVAMFAPGSNQPAKHSGTAKVERQTIVYPGNAKVGLAGRNDPPPKAEEMDAALEADVVRLLALGAATAPAQLAGQHDAVAAAATEPLARLHYAVLRALRSGSPADAKAAEELAQSLLDGTVKTARLMQILQQRAKNP